MSKFKFSIKQKLQGTLARTGEIVTPHGIIETPAFVTVGTKATVKSLTPEMVASIGSQVVLANTYHLYLEPGEDIVAQAGGFAKFMNWSGPTMTDSGGFQVFSLGAAFGTSVSKIAKNADDRGQDADSRGTDTFVPPVRPFASHSHESAPSSPPEKMAIIDDDGVTFKSYLDGSEHRFTPERSMEIQWNLGADMIFAFDECTSPHASLDYQKEAMARTHAWAERCIKRHEELDPENIQALFGVVQGGRSRELREESARTLAAMKSTRTDGGDGGPARTDENRGGFDGFGIGGSFDKEDMYSVVGWVNQILPEDKPRHLLGIGEPVDIFGGVENGADLFDCVAATRMARNGALHTRDGRINITNTKYRTDFTPIEADCSCYTCKHYTRAYLAHLFRSGEMLAATLASVHNLAFMNKLLSDIRESIASNTFFELKERFLRDYYKKE